MIVQKKRAFQRIKEPEDQNQAIRKAKANDLVREEEFQTLKEGLARLIKENRKSEKSKKSGGKVKEFFKSSPMTYVLIVFIIVISIAFGVMYARVEVLSKAIKDQSKEFPARTNLIRSRIRPRYPKLVIG